MSKSFEPDTHEDVVTSDLMTLRTDIEKNRNEALLYLINTHTKQEAIMFMRLTRMV